MRLILQAKVITRKPSKWNIKPDEGEPVLTESWDQGCQHNQVPYVSAVKNLPEVWYHGSDRPRSEWVLDNVGLKGANDNQGPGLYFTSDLRNARSYGENIAFVKLNLRKLVPRVGSVWRYRDRIEWLIKRAPDYKETLENWGEDYYKALRDAVNGMITYSDGPFDAFTQVWADFYPGDAKSYLERMSQWWDGTVVTMESAYYGQVRHAIVFNPLKIKTIRLTTRTELDRENERSILH
jgi:hypothetical protein